MVKMLGAESDHRIVDEEWLERVGFSRVAGQQWELPGEWSSHAMAAPFLRFKFMPYEPPAAYMSFSGRAGEWYRVDLIARSQVYHWCKTFGVSK